MVVVFFMELRCTEITGLDCPVQFTGEAAEEQMGAHLIGSHGIKDNPIIETVEPENFGFKKEVDIAKPAKKRKGKKFGIL